MRSRPALLIGLCLFSAAAVSWARDRVAGTLAYAFVFFAWNPLFAWEISAQAHTEGLVLVGMVAFVWAATRGREWLAALGLACAVYAKLCQARPRAAALPLPLLRLSAQAAAGDRHGGGGRRAGSRVDGAILAGRLHGARAGGHAAGGLIADGALAYRFRRLARAAAGEHARREVYWVALAIGTMLLASFGIRAALRARSLRQVLRDGLVFFLLYDLIAAPWFQSWYVTWLLPLGLATP